LSGNNIKCLSKIFFSPFELRCKFASLRPAFIPQAQPGCFKRFRGFNFQYFDNFNDAIVVFVISYPFADCCIQ